MAFRALLFSKSPESMAALTTACESAGVRLEGCSDIFSAIKIATQQPFACLLIDWSDQPEASFLLKRARESGSNKNAVAIAIVDRDPTPAEMRDHELDFLIYRPIDPAEAGAVLDKASQKVRTSGADNAADAQEAHGEPPGTISSAAASSSPESTDQQQPTGATIFEASANEENSEAEDEVNEGEPGARGSSSSVLRKACAVVLVLAAVFLVWGARNEVLYLARSPEGPVNVLKQSVAALFSVNSADVMPVRPVQMEARHDEDAAGSVGIASAPAPQIGVVEDQPELSGSSLQLRKAADFPLATPVYEHPEQAPAQTQSRRATIPDSLRGSAPITRPVVVTVNPAQMMPVAIPVPSSSQGFTEPVDLSEEAERALLLQSGNPAYPPEAMAQKLHGLVVLQVTIGRDGSVEDLKLVRGNFVLAKAAIAAVKQWRFQPYSVNGHPARTQTLITLNFSYPQS